MRTRELIGTVLMVVGFVFWFHLPPLAYHGLLGTVFFLAGLELRINRLEDR